jgi:predicted nucleic acid-binding protein
MPPVRRRKNLFIDQRRIDRAKALLHTDATFGAVLQEFHRRSLPRLVLSTVVAAELLVGAQRADRERSVRRALIEPFRVRCRLITPGWSTWELVAHLDRNLRKRPANRQCLEQRSFFQDMLIAASAHELGATVVTENVADFALIARYLDFAFVPPFPPSPAV